MTDNFWDQLLSVLSRQRKEYEGFAALLKRKEDLIIKGKAKELEKLVKEENKRVDRVEDLETERLAIVGLLVDEGEKPPSLMELLAGAPEAVRERVENEAMGLMETLNSIASLNRSNAELIQTSSRFIEYNLNLLTSAGVRPNVYGETGRMRSTEKNISGFLNRQV